MAAVDTPNGEMFVGAVNQAAVGQLTRQASSLSTVSRVFHTLDAEFAARRNLWRT